MKLIPRNPAFVERIRDQLTRQRFMQHIGFDLHTIEAGRTAGELTLQALHEQQDGFVHGGLVATLADIVAGFAACTLVEAHQDVVTGEIKISYFRKGVGDKLRAVGWVKKPGSRLHFCEAEVYAVDAHGHETLIAHATTTMIVL